jgi:hypothetical protein
VVWQSAARFLNSGCAGRDLVHFRTRRGTKVTKTKAAGELSLPPRLCDLYRILIRSNRGYGMMRSASVSV